VDIRDAFFDELYRIASKDANVILLTADMGAFGLDKLKKDFPDQYINVGIAEQNLVSLAAGLALGGKKVFIYTIAAFLIYRAYDQIRIDICDMDLPVVLIGAGAGTVYKNEGATHHAIYDKDIVELLPNIEVFTPSNSQEAEASVQYAYQSNHPVYIRLGRGDVFQDN